MPVVQWDNAKMPALAKTDQQTGESRSLFGHSLDVAHCAHAMLIRGVLRHRLQVISGIDVTEPVAARIAILVGMHDFGKALNGFQERISGHSRGRGHVSEALAAIAAQVPGQSDRLHNALSIGLLCNWFEDPGEALYSVLCHHGEPVSQSRIDACYATTKSDLAPQGHYDPVEEIGTLTTILLAAFPQALQPAPSIPCPTRFLHALAGLTMTADWMGSDARWHPLAGPENRPEAALRLLEDTGWCAWHQGAAAEAVLGGYAPRAAQTGMLELPLDHHLVTLEAPTGTGKTEAALIWASRLAAAELVDGMFFAVPTRSAATELHARIARLMTGPHPRLAGRVVRAVSGQIDTDHPVAMFNEDVTPTWALGSSRRTMAAPIAVGTIDQAMLSQMKVRHGHLRSNCLSRQLLVIDEAHASDPYMSEIICRLVQEHVAAGSYALLMSATLGETLRSRLLQQPRAPIDVAVSRHYPMISAKALSLPVPVMEGRTTHVRIEPHQRVLTAAVASARSGESVLLIRSTVADALANYRTMLGQGVESLLHHSRFADVDRQFLDGSLLDILGPRGNRRGIVVVATQTAEQSLDIDADLLVTDACPADVLLQRLGRLHRHRSGTEPTCLVIDPGDWEGYVTATGKPMGRRGQGWPWVYNPLSVRETLTWIKTAGTIRMPDDLRTLVELATHADHLEARAKEHGPAWELLWRNLYAKGLADRMVGRGVLVDRTLPYAEALVDPDAATRLGDGSVDVRMTGLRSPFSGSAIDVMPVRAMWLAGVKPDTAGIAGPADPDGRCTIQIGHRQFTYGREGLQRV